ncbi:MAG: preprotein translocase subunit SecG [Mycoplasmatales bacterium]|nr:preprotein translocase subunit SecG [Mycoplasmatales bacterium]
MLTVFWITFSVAIFIIVVSLIMSPESSSFSGALVGSSDLELFKEKKERGSKIFLKWSMFSLGIALMIGTLIVRSLM